MRACACESRAQRHLAAAAAALRNQSGAGRVSRNWSAREERLPLQIIGVFFPPFSLSFATLPDEIKVSELIIGEKEEENWPARARRRRRYATTRSPRVVQSRAGGQICRAYMPAKPFGLSPRSMFRSSSRLELFAAGHSDRLSAAPRLDSIVHHSHSFASSRGGALHSNEPPPPPLAGGETMIDLETSGFTCNSMAAAAAHSMIGPMTSPGCCLSRAALPAALAPAARTNSRAKRLPAAGNGSMN